MADSVLVGLCTVLLDYLDGKKTIRDCAEWLAGVDWDDPAMDVQTKQMLGRCELLTTEVGDGMRARPWPPALEPVGTTTITGSDDKLCWLPFRRGVNNDNVL